MAKTREQLAKLLLEWEARLPSLRAEYADMADYTMAFLGMTEEVAEDIGESDAAWFLDRLKSLHRRYAETLARPVSYLRLVA